MPGEEDSQLGERERESRALVGIRRRRLALVFPSAKAAAVSRGSQPIGGDVAEPAGLGSSRTRPWRSPANANANAGANANAASLATPPPLLLFLLFLFLFPSRKPPKVQPPASRSPSGLAAHDQDARGFLARPRSDRLVPAQRGRFRGTFTASRQLRQELSAGETFSSLPLLRCQHRRPRLNGFAPLRALAPRRQLGSSERFRPEHLP